MPIADERIAFEAAQAAALADADERERTAADKRRQQLQMAREDVGLYCEIVEKQEAAFAIGCSSNIWSDKGSTGLGWSGAALKRTYCSANTAI